MEVDDASCLVFGHFDEPDPYLSVQRLEGDSGDAGQAARARPEACAANLPAGRRGGAEAVAHCRHGRE